MRSKKVPAKLILLFFNVYMFPAVVANWINFDLESEGSLRFIVHYNIFIIYFVGLHLFLLKIYHWLCSNHAQFSFHIIQIKYIAHIYFIFCQFIIMNPITLRFLNKELEIKYEEYSIEEQMQTIQEYLKQSIVLCAICVMAFYIEGLYYCSCFFLITFSSSVGYCFILKKVPAKLTILFFNSYLFLVVIAYWIVFHLDSRSVRFLIHYIIFIIFCGVTFVFTENILLAMCQMSFYVSSCAFIINYYHQKSILQMIWIPIITIWFLQFHAKIKRKRQLYQQSQINQSIYELIKQTTKDEFYLFSYDSEQYNYTLQLSNSEQFQINEFLKNFYQGNTNLSTYLYKEFVQRNNNTHSILEINGFYSNGKTPQKYYLYVQTYPKLLFYMRMIPPTYKPKQMFIYHHQLFNKFFNKIDKLRIKSSIQVEQVIYLINKLKLYFYLQTISATLHFQAIDQKSICLKKLFHFICNLKA